MIKVVYKSYQKIYLSIYEKVCRFFTSIYFFINGVKFKRFSSIGIPLLDIDKDCICEFGESFTMVNKDKFATLGRNNRCKIVVANNAKLIIGEKVAMSNTTIVASLSVKLGNNVMIGGGVTIVDTDFHSLNPNHWHTVADLINMKKAPVVINDNVFIGMNTIILKGVVIGSNTVIAAGSVVAKSIPDNQIWGGNPAKFIKNNV